MAQEKMMSLAQIRKVLSKREDSTELCLHRTKWKDWQRMVYKVKTIHQCQTRKSPDCPVLDTTDHSSPSHTCLCEELASELSGGRHCVLGTTLGVGIGKKREDIASAFKDVTTLMTGISNNPDQ